MKGQVIKLKAKLKADSPGFTLAKVMVVVGIRDFGVDCRQSLSNPLSGEGLAGRCSGHKRIAPRQLHIRQ